MGERKVTVMILKVDLQCDRCYKKVKKVLCKFPEIRDRLFDEKSNTIMIKVFCCDPERLRNKLCNKGRGSIKSIEIKEPDVPKLAENPKPDSPPKPQETTPPPAPKPESPKNPPPPKTPEAEQTKPAPRAPEPVPKATEPTPKPINSEPMAIEPRPLYGSEPIPTCCEQCYGNRSGGPCNFSNGARPLGYSHWSNYGRASDNGYGPNGPNRLCHPGRCAEYFSEENPAGCSVM